MKVKQGFVVLVRFPFTDQIGTKTRPALVVSGASFNHSADALLVPITTQGKRSSLVLPLKASDLLQGNLEKSSFIKCGHLTVFDQALVTRVVARLTTNKLNEVLAVCRAVFD